MSEPLLAATGLTRHFPVRENPFAPARLARAVDGVDLALHPGETLGVAGESGCGKSTVARLLMGLLPPTAGTVRYRGRELAAMDRRELLAFRKDVQMIFQDPFSSLNPRMRVGEIVGEGYAIHGLASGAQRRELVSELLARVGLSADQMDRYPHEFSGGQRQRIGIARALAVSPRVLIADEPVSALDISIQAQIINLLQDLQQEFGLAYLFISHDLAVVRHLSSRIAVMYLGRIVETGPAAAVFDRGLHPYTEALLAAIPRLGDHRHGERLVLQGDIPSALAPPPGCPFHPRCPYAKELCRTAPPPLEEKEPAHLAACHFSTELYR
jgi:peptide/nickel transport system ATP-binding protein